MGIDGLKTDGSEAIFGRNVSFADGHKGDAMHNGYSNAYTGAYSSYVQSKTIEWKCIKRQEANYPANADQWQPGSNSSITTPGCGSGGSTSGGF